MSYRTYVLISIFFPGLMPPGFAASGEAVLKPVNGTGFHLVSFIGSILGRCPRLE